MRRAVLVMVGAVALAVLGAVAALALPPGGTFLDDDGLVHEPAIEAIAARGITNGCDTVLYCPGAPVTRGQMAAFLDRALNLPPAPNGDPFTDDDASIFEDSIERLAFAGITQGCGPSLFCPDDSVTRAEMAAFLVRALALAPAPPGDPFTDDNGNEFEDEIERIAFVGITVGCAPSLYCPAAPVTRAQMATFITRALGLTPIVPTPARPSERCARDRAQCPPIGNPDGSSTVPTGGAAESIANPDTVIGTGTPVGCTSSAVVAAVALGGTITFNCGPDPVLIEMTETARIFNNANPDVVIDGGGLVTLSGMGQRRVLYMNTCDPDLVWTTPRCDNQDHPRLTLQNINFIRGATTGVGMAGGGGAVWVRGGRFKIVNAGFFDNTCAEFGPDLGGASVRVFSQYNNLPVYVTNSTFGGAANFGNECSNSGGISSIGVSWVVTNSLFSNNLAVGIGANPPRSGTPGGGNGGAIYMDGNAIHLTLDGVLIEDNNAREGGGGVFFVSNNRTGTVTIRNSVLRRNVSERFETAGFPGMFVLAASPPSVVNSTIE
ncbi:MAG: hypothetical protein BMS9Abin17_0741 [Acidimicrobiia bacterium]|nr:MAG: hypothetical protein BMS9Abin17_0741 [Acidimicrobiia bacterium]